MRLFRILTALLPFLCAAQAQAVDPLEAKLTAILRDSHVPGAGIAIVRRGHAPRILSLGLADVAAKRPVDAQTMFRTASVGKMFTTLAVMRLVEDGKLSLDAPLRSVAPEVAFDNPWESVAPVRIAHLLEHTTGWDDIHFAEYAYDNSAEVPLAQAVAFHPDSRTSRWMPGTRASYASSGPTVAGYVVQKISGRRFEDYVAEHVFKPLHMDSATYFADAAYRQHGATLYSRAGMVEPYNHILYRPAGSTNVTAADMGKLLAFFLDRGMVDGHQLFAASTLERMENAQTTIGARAGQHGDVGMGELHMGYRGYRFSGHTGDIDGASSQFWYQPELGIGFVAMINNGDQDALWKMRQVVLDSLIRDVEPAAATAALGTNWQGVDGLYVEVNPRMELMRMQLPFGAVRFAYAPHYLLRSSVLASWSDKLAPAAGGMAVEPFTGLPTIVRAIDPLAGDVVVVGDTVYARTSPLRVYGPAGLGAALLLMSAASLLFALVWIPRRLLGRIGAGPAVSVRVWPLAATLLLAGAFFTLPVLQPSVRAIGSVSAVSLLVMALTAAYGAAALIGVVHVVHQRGAAMHRGAYWFAAVHAALHGCAALYLSWYGMLGLRLWA